MPGKCKFQESWLSKEIYKDWLVEDALDIHFARCRACGKSIKLQTMGEAALTSHAGGAGHKAAVRKLQEGSGVTINAYVQVNGNNNNNQEDDTKEQVAICLQRDALDTNWSDLNHRPTANSTSHNAELQDVGINALFFTAPGTSRLLGQRLPPAGSRRSEHQQRTEALEQQQQMKILEWENRMKVLAWEQELVREKRKAALQKRKAFRMKAAYYKAKLRRMGEDVPSSSSSSDEQ
ncbi:uncharacterized protein fsbp isoform X2 [Salarias fasciatus]|uniref:uncharacterized protein fsbp isoform X2 n=1 Tax=Salarias fasciatus TaxID=181472 RepID=UPI001176B9B2|nr:uncharacterized protein LOC115407963 isoform X2 [Salarias fasciatus]